MPEEQSMITLREREKAFEAKFAHDAEMQFRAEARRDKMAGLWAAGLLGKSDASAEAYALEVITSDLEEAGSEDVIRKLTADLNGKVTIDEIRSKLDELLLLAKSQLLSED
jgi:hypothetical protein